MTKRNSLTAISLFTSGGLGDLAIREAGFEILVSNELHEDRHAIFSFNFPDCYCITGDIRERVDDLIAAARYHLNGRTLDLLYATPPCQGMSKNGRGKLLSAIRAGRKAPMDERNRLIIPTMAIARALQPRIILLENVPEMKDTIILDERGEAVLILEYIARELGSEYEGLAEIVEFANYGVPQRRQRLLTMFSRSPILCEWLRCSGCFVPPPTHAERPSDDCSPWMTVRDAIGELPPLDAKDPRTAKSSIPFHWVPTLDPRKYWWVEHTRPERSAFDNQCVQCGFEENPSHCAQRDCEGINRASLQTPLHCMKCGALLPRPSVERDGKLMIMRGFTSAYKRMSYDRPSPALTRNLSYACSDNKLHPDQNRVLSLLEAFRLHTLDRFVYEWRRRDGNKVSDKTIREVIGESIPPAGFLTIMKHLVHLDSGDMRPSAWASAGPLFALS